MQEEAYMKLMKIEKESAPHKHHLGDTIESDIVLKISDKYLVFIDAGTPVDENLLYLAKI